MAEEFDALAVIESLGRPYTKAEIERMEEAARKASYYAEIAGIEQLRLALRGGSLEGRDIDWKAQRRGREILDYREAVADAIYSGTPLPAALALEPVEVAEPVKPRPWPKSARVPGVDIPPKSKGEGRGRFRDSPRQVAKRAGHTHYWSGGVCLRGHNSARYVSTGQCMACMKEGVAEKRAKKIVAKP